MSHSKPLLVQVVQIAGLTMLFCGATASHIAMGLGINQLSDHPTPLLNTSDRAVPISEADADTIEKWILGNAVNSIFGVDGFFVGRIEVVLAEPNGNRSGGVRS